LGIGKLSHLLASKTVIIADGAMGTELQRAGLPKGIAPEQWNLDNPLAIRQVHRRYIEAGSDLILTNTFGGSRLRLATFGLADRVGVINQTAVCLARQEASGAMVVGSIGPTGWGVAPHGRASQSTCRAAYAEQALILAEAGVDALLIETMVDLEETQMAVEGMKPIVDVPILVTMVFGENGRTFTGFMANEVVNTLWAMGVAVVGANCSSSMAGMLAAIHEMRAANPEAALMVKPNAGLPHLDHGQMIYDLEPETLASYTDQFLQAGVSVIGGCCGTTPAHIAALKAAVVSKRKSIASIN